MNGSVIDTKALCRNLMLFHAGKIMLCDLNLNAENLLAHKKLHLTQLGVKLLGCSSRLNPGLILVSFSMFFAYVDHCPHRLPRIRMISYFSLKPAIFRGTR